MSFKLGNSEIVKDGRFFNNINESILTDSIQGSCLTLKEAWQTKDLRPGRGDEWLNAVLVKNK